MLSVTDVDSAEGKVVVLFSETTACVFEQLTIIIADKTINDIVNKCFLVICIYLLSTVH